MAFIFGFIIGLLAGGVAIFLVQKGKITALQQEIESRKKRIKSLEESHESRMQKTITSMQQDFQVQTNQATEAAVAALKESHDSQITELENSHQSQVEELNAKYQVEIKELQAKIQELETSSQNTFPTIATAGLAAGVATAGLAAGIDQVKPELTVDQDDIELENIPETATEEVAEVTTDTASPFESVNLQATTDTEGDLEEFTPDLGAAASPWDEITAETTPREEIDELSSDVTATASPLESVSLEAPTDTEGDLEEFIPDFGTAASPWDETTAETTPREKVDELALDTEEDLDFPAAEIEASAKSSFDDLDAMLATPTAEEELALDTEEDLDFPAAEIEASAKSSFDDLDAMLATPTKEEDSNSSESFFDELKTFPEDMQENDPLNNLDISEELSELNHREDSEQEKAELFMSEKKSDLDSEIKDFFDMFNTEKSDNSEDDSERLSP